MNLAWSITVGCIDEVRQNRSSLGDDFNHISPHDLEILESKIVARQQIKVNNALALLQNSLEIFLKARIAEVSPFLLISDNTRSWPKQDAQGNISFSDFRTLDATELCKVADIVSVYKLPSSFVELYNRIRLERNKIIHLDYSQIRYKSSKMMTDTLVCYYALFNKIPWQAFRQIYLERNEIQHDYFDETILSHDNYLTEIDIMMDVLSDTELKTFLNFNQQKPLIFCPECCYRTSKYYVGKYMYAQRQSDGTIFCIACATDYENEATYRKSFEIYGINVPDE